MSSSSESGTLLGKCFADILFTRTHFENSTDSAPSIYPMVDVRILLYYSSLIL